MAGARPGVDSLRSRGKKGRSCAPRTDGPPSPPSPRINQPLPREQPVQTTTDRFYSTGSLPSRAEQDTDPLFRCEAEKARVAVTGLAVFADQTAAIPSHTPARPPHNPCHPHTAPLARTKYLRQGGTSRCRGKQGLPKLELPAPRPPEARAQAQRSSKRRAQPQRRARAGFRPRPTVRDHPEAPAPAPFSSPPSPLPAHLDTRQLDSKDLVPLTITRQHTKTRQPTAPAFPALVRLVDRTSLCSRA